MKTLITAMILLAVAGNVYAEDLHIAIPGKPASPDHWKLDDSFASLVTHNNIFECLVEYDENNVVVPCIAESWKTEDAGRIWIFELKDGVRFHDGSILTSADVAESITNNSKYFKGKVESVGRLKVRFTLEEKTASFLKSLTKVYYSIAKQGENGSVFGTGPFLMEKWDDSNRIILRAYEGYWGNTPQIDRVVFHCMMEPEASLGLLKEGMIDIVYMVPLSLAREVASDPDLVLSRVDGASLAYIHINPDRPQLGDREFRYALNMVIDRDRIIREIYNGYAVECRNVLPPVIDSKQDSRSMIPYNPGEAKRIIEAQIGAEERVFRMIGLPFARPYVPDPHGLARLIKEDLENAGMKIEYVPTSTWAEWLEIAAEGDYDLVVSGWLLDSMNPDDFYSDIFCVSGEKCTFTNAWMNEAFRTLIITARGSVSIRRQRQLYGRAEDILFTEYPWIMLVHPHQLGAYRADVKGLVFSPIARLGLGDVSK